MIPDTQGAELVTDYHPDPRDYRWVLIALSIGFAVIAWRCL